MSVLGKKWHIKNQTKDTPPLEKILENRGITTHKQRDEFFNPSLKNHLHDPFLFPDMEKALFRIQNAIRQKERIIIFGDYDLDGISGTALLMHTLKDLGAIVSYRLPHRVNDGYGLSDRFIEEFSRLNIKLLITVDCGISSAPQISLAKKCNIDVIVTDHHTLSQNFPSDAYAVIHPKLSNNSYPFSELTGAGVAFKLATALYGSDLEAPEKLEALLDLASLGTVADCGPLIGENRTIVKLGLKQLINTKWPGLRELKKIAGVTDERCQDTDCIGFHLGPRLNAAGRIDTPYFSLQLLLSDGEKAQKFAHKLEKLNQSRQQMTIKAMKQAEDSFQKEGISPHILIAYHHNLHTGLLGLIASKIAEKYNRPAVIMEDRGNSLIGSIRSRNSFNAIEALSFHKDLLSKFGGHNQAAGFELNKDNLSPFIEGMVEFARQNVSSKELQKSVEIDCELDHHEIHAQLYRDIQPCGPFGVENEKPQFLLRNLKVRQLSFAGAEQKHLKLRLGINGTVWDAIGFSLGSYSSHVKSTIDIAFRLSQNTWQGRTTLQCEIVDFNS